MIQFPCVVRFENGEIFLDVPSISPVVESGVEVWNVTELDRYNTENTPQDYRVVFNPESPTPKSIRVVSWENVHPNDWSPELRQVNDSYESVM